MYTYTDYSPKKPIVTPPVRRSSIGWLKFLKLLLMPLVRLGRDFCLWTSMHGFNHIAWPRRHWLERLLWALVTAAAIWGAVDVSLGQLQRYYENPTVVTLEKDFRTWKSSLPSVTACEQNRVKASKVPAAIQRFWNVTPEHEKYDYYVSFVEVVANSDLFNLEGFQKYKDDQTLNVDMVALAKAVVPDMIVKITWPDQLDTPWVPVMTESGVCFNINSIAVVDVALETLNPNDTKKYPVGCIYSSMMCFVLLEMTNAYSFYVHSPYDVVDITAPPKVIIPGLRRYETISVIETRCGKGVLDLEPTRRGCRFINEPTDDSKKVYSANSCWQTCRARLAFKLCKCMPFYYFFEEGVPCTPAGMACLSHHAGDLSNKKGARCECAQQCLTSTYRPISVEENFWPKGPLGSSAAVRFLMQPPRTRYTREIVFHFQDLVVSFGGAAGLFLGASFISFVEIVYFVLERVLGFCIGDNKTQEETIKKKQATIPYETARILQLSDILERQRRFDHGRHMKLYY